MARIPRVVLPGIPHHVTQRGNRHQKVFFSAGDYQKYLDYILDGCRTSCTACWAYCLMPNHIHLVLVPEKESGLREALAEPHRRYTRMINFRHGWRGHMWQERFHSFPMDESHLFAAIRYVELNPVRAGMVRTASEWPWSSARSHIEKSHEPLLDRPALLEQISDWADYLGAGITEQRLESIRCHTRTGRPLGSERFLDRAELVEGRALRPGRPGRKPRRSLNEAM